ncbi:MAG: VOC family protein [Candidatus Limnocylindria bacterium]
MLAYADADRAADWICRAFGFREVQRYSNTAGTVTDVVLERDDGATVLVGHPHDAYEGPSAHAAHCAAAARWLDRPVIVDGLVVYVADVEAHHAAAVAAGARLISGLETNPLQRQYRVEDLEGHRWMFATRIPR